MPPSQGQGGWVGRRWRQRRELPGWVHLWGLDRRRRRNRHRRSRQPLRAGRRLLPRQQRPVNSYTICWGSVLCTFLYFYKKESITSPQRRFLWDDAIWFWLNLSIFFAPLSENRTTVVHFLTIPLEWFIFSWFHYFDALELQNEPRLKCLRAPQS